ncbi:transposase domain-containing protein [Bradyrhizobium cenepequi]
MVVAYGHRHREHIREGVFVLEDDINLSADHWGPLFTYLTDVLARIANGHPNGEIDQLLPWAYKRQDLRAVA